VEDTLAMSGAALLLAGALKPANKLRFAAEQR
jgi:hypothetical protein